MQKLLLRFCIFIFCLFLLNYVLRNFIQNKLNVSTLPEKKQKFNEISKNKFNAILLGSSRSYTAINVRNLDSLQYKKSKLKTYNLGMSALFFPNTYFIAKEIISNISLKPNLLIIEIGYDDRYLLADYYSLINEPYFSFFKKLTLAELYFFVRIRIKTSFEWLHGSFPTFLAKTQNGFLTMNQRGKYEPAHFVQHELYLKNEIEKTKNYDPRFKTENAINTVEAKIFQNYINQFSIFARKENVKVIYFLPNRISPENRKIIVPVYNSLADSIKFNPNLSPDFDQLMLPKYSWDLSHLTDSGAVIYSKIFAEEFKRQIIDKGYLE